MKIKKRDSLKIIVFPMKNKDFQGSLPRWKHCVCLLIRVFLFKKKRCKNDEKNVFFNQKLNPNRWWPQIRQKTPPDTLPETTVWATNALFIVFCTPAARGWAPKMTSGRRPGGVRDASKSSLIFAASQNRHDRPPDDSREVLGHLQGTLRDDFATNFW